VKTQRHHHPNRAANFFRGEKPLASLPAMNLALADITSMKKSKAKKQKKKQQPSTAPQPVFMTIDLPESISPIDRGAIDEEVDDALGEAGVGEVTGGGGFVSLGGDTCAIAGLSGSKIDVDVTDVAKALTVMRRVLKRLRVPKATTLTEHSAEIIVHKVYVG